jgi:hypothetical protein
MRRANLPQLPDEFRELFPAAREMVRSRCGELIAEDRGLRIDGRQTQSFLNASSSILLPSQTPGVSTR